MQEKCQNNPKQCNKLETEPNGEHRPANKCLAFGSHFTVWKYVLYMAKNILKMYK